MRKGMLSLSHESARKTVPAAPQAQARQSAPKVSPSPAPPPPETPKPEPPQRINGALAQALKSHTEAAQRARNRAAQEIQDKD